MNGEPYLQVFEQYNYYVGGGSVDNFYDNLRNTEIDIVLHARDSNGREYLLIGEAKHTQTFGVDSKLVLVHQLIRQFVMATILMRILDRDILIIPFVLCDNNKVESVRKKAQVCFMASEGIWYMSKRNILGWDEYLN